MKARCLTPSLDIQEDLFSMEGDCLNIWDSQWVIMIDYLEQSRTINGSNYAGKLRRLRQEITSKMQGKRTRCILLLQDNAHG